MNWVRRLVECTAFSSQLKMVTIEIRRCFFSPSAFHWICKLAFLIELVGCIFERNKTAAQSRKREQKSNLKNWFPCFSPHQDPKLQTQSTALTRTRTTACSVFSTTRKPVANLSYMSSKNQVRDANACSVLSSSWGFCRTERKLLGWHEPGGGHMGQGRMNWERRGERVCFSRPCSSCHFPTRLLSSAR